jgi:hypothetical protein
MSELMTGRAAAEGDTRPDLRPPDVPEVLLAPDEDLVPPTPPEGLDTVLYEHDERAARADLRRQIAAMELQLARLFGSAFPRHEIEFGVPGMGGPRLLAVDELERVRDSLAARLQDVKGRLGDRVYVETRNRELIEEMIADPAAHKWVRVFNEDIGEPGCKHWHSKPRWGPLGMVMGWWRVKISSGCPLAEGLRPPESLMPTKRQRRKRRRRREGGAQVPAADPGQSAAGADDTPRTAAARRRGAPGKPPQAPWGSFPLTELVVLVALIMLVGGFFVSPPRGAIMIGTGLVLGSLAGLELSAREHFAGHRSHTLLLAGAVGMLVFGGLFVGVSALHPAICAAGGALAFGGSAWFFASAFRRRSGGALYRIKA